MSLFIAVCLKNGYIRIILLFIGWIISDNSYWFLVVYVTSVMLDGIDGWAARKFNQVSDFGAWLDVIIDNIGRGMLWCLISPSGYFVSVVEWVSFISNYTQRGSSWKQLQEPPEFAAKVMKNGCRTPPGMFAIAGLHFLPVWLYVIQRRILAEALIGVFVKLQYIVLGFLLVGRALAMSVEVWCIFAHIRRLLIQEMVHMH
ncbi:CDP-diacylglycerol--inositol 3-phosphatidyltransferase 1-like isoform X3 [Limulus polyphemus]|uniref:CDP-diacylglycerol--inositol 3-phosphatidyltransferase 1-like isoform X3 n=1 Tax=Limulus polyphemus TaxID=6850 RepID=A0ABM1T6W1_LIMPO|nr:CDP-diacylglycerol--inositol 3-phosphatidyltransferase 1-like isoform X3 [Limulus polyphemus]